jgi:hypothetical protein
VISVLIFLIEGPRREQGKCAEHHQSHLPDTDEPLGSKENPFADAEPTVECSRSLNLGTWCLSTSGTYPERSRRENRVIFLGVDSPDRVSPRPRGMAEELEWTCSTAGGQIDPKVARREARVTVSAMFAWAPRCACIISISARLIEPFARRS